MIVFPTLFLIVLFLIQIPAFVGIVLVVAALRLRAVSAKCPVCGYDTRASVARCPECGADLAAALRRSFRGPRLLGILGACLVAVPLLIDIGLVVLLVVLGHSFFGKFA